MLFPMVLLTCRELAGNIVKSAIFVKNFGFWADFSPPLPANFHPELARLTKIFSRMLLHVETSEKNFGVMCTPEKWFVGPPK